VLVCTTIIETGIDIPTANTIIIERADKLGLAQLHQLRGRVGRSHHQAYAFCLTPPPTVLTADAVKRLDALSTLETLGSGFTLATHDLEIRGAGELLGEEQSGNMQAVGFNLYMELLEQAIKTLQSGKEIDLNVTIFKGIEIDLLIPALIPNNYLDDVHVRLIQYKRIAMAKDISKLEELQVEMIDRFGNLPFQTKNLFTIAVLKLYCQQLGITKIKVGLKSGVVDFTEQPNIDPNVIIALLQKNPTCYKLNGPNSIKFQQDLATGEARVDFVKKLFKQLSKGEIVI
jgi:transcription-repair coupling factor (superfamily II helicase)